MSDYSASPSDHHNEIQAPKRKATQAGLDGHATGRSVKRRASKACQCCRARKVRCNVTEHGAPCTNCRLDEVDCIVSESRRKKLVPHSRAIAGVSTSKPHCCLINGFRYGMFHPVSSCNIGWGVGTFGLAIWTALHLWQLPRAFEPMAANALTPNVRLVLTVAGNGAKMTNKLRKTQA